VDGVWHTQVLGADMLAHKSNL